jgi:Derlin-2/3
MMTLEQWYRQMPVVTRSYLTLSFLTTAGCALELISPFSVYYNSHLIFHKYQLWHGLPTPLPQPQLHL